MNLYGTVADGRGFASRDVAGGMYQAAIPDAYPGTLNVELGSVDWLIEPPTPLGFIQHPHGYPLMLWRGKAGDVPVLVMWPQRLPLETHVELLASVRLRDELDVETGDALSVLVQ